MVVQFNKKQNKIFFSSANVWAGTLNEQSDNLTRYINLSEIADSLATENEVLYDQLEKIKFINALPTDSLRENPTLQQFSFKAARVINNSIQKNNNFLTINIGRKDGIEPHMGVIASKGLAGIVVGVSEHYSRVMSLLHKQTRISASIRDEDFFGSLVWKDNDPRFMMLENIPKHAIIDTTDLIQTSGYSSIFPEGILIGKVESVDHVSGSNFHRVKVRLNNDLSQQKYVYVVKNKNRAEQLELEEAINE